MAGKSTGWVMGTPMGQPMGQPPSYNAATGVPVGNTHTHTVPNPNPYVIGLHEAHYTGTTSYSNGGAAGNPYVHVSAQPGSANSS
jgi:hypothetical protein